MPSVVCGLYRALLIGFSDVHSCESKEKIRLKMKIIWDRKRTKASIERMCVRDWQEAVAEAARQGGLGDEEVEWDTYKNLKQQIRLEQLTAAKQDRIQLKEERRAMRKAMRGNGYSLEHRMKISEAIRAKWEDPVNIIKPFGFLQCFKGKLTVASKLHTREKGRYAG